jgi:hypothetical protein
MYSVKAYPIPIVIHIEFDLNIWMTHATDLLTYLLGQWRSRERLVVDDQPLQDCCTAGYKLHKLQPFRTICKTFHFYLLECTECNSFNVTSLFQATRARRRARIRLEKRK